MNKARSSIRVGVLLPAMAALAGCGSSSSTSAAPTSHSSSHTSTAAAVASGRVRVSISGYAFHAATITVARGTRVTFTNHDQTAHTATSIHSAFDTGTVGPGRSATVTLRKPGTFTYYCQFHAFMHGTIVVN